MAWALWVAVAAQALLHRRVWQAAIWLYPVLTTLDVLATANHYLLDAVAAPATVALAYLLAWLASRVAGACRRRARPVVVPGRPEASPGPGTSAPPGPLPSQTPAGRIRE